MSAGGTGGITYKQCFGLFPVIYTSCLSPERLIIPELDRSIRPNKQTYIRIYYDMLLVLVLAHHSTTIHSNMLPHMSHGYHTCTKPRTQLASALLWDLHVHFTIYCVYCIVFINANYNWPTMCDTDTAEQTLLFRRLVIVQISHPNICWCPSVHLKYVEFVYSQF